MSEEQHPNKAIKRRTGQPTKLNEQRESIIKEHIIAGHCDWVAAEAAGINKTTLSDWKRWGREGKEPYASFLTRFESWEASRLSQLESMYIAKSLAADSPAHIYKLMQIYHPEHYQDVQKVEAVVRKTHDYSKLSEEELVVLSKIGEKLEND